MQSFQTAVSRLICGWYYSGGTHDFDYIFIGLLCAHTTAPSQPVRNVVSLPISPTVANLTWQVS